MDQFFDVEPEPGDDEHALRRKRVMKAALSDPSGFTAVLIGNACIEFYLRRMLMHTLEDPAAFFGKNGEEVHYDFIVLLKLVVASGAIPKEQYQFFKAFANLRNVFAHNPDANLADDLPEFKKLLISIGDEPIDFTRRGAANNAFFSLCNNVDYLLNLIQIHHEGAEVELWDRMINQQQHGPSFN